MVVVTFIRALRHHQYVAVETTAPVLQRSIKNFILDKIFLQLVHPHHNQDLLEALHTVPGVILIVVVVDINELQALLSQHIIRRRHTRVECLTGRLLVVLTAIMMLLWRFTLIKYVHLLMLLYSIVYNNSNVYREYVYVYGIRNSVKFTLCAYV